MSSDSVAIPQTLVVVPNASITASYTAMGSQYTIPIRFVEIYNGTNQGTFFSLDGSTNNFYVATLQSLTLPLLLKGYSQFYIKYETAPASGSVYLAAVG